MLALCGLTTRRPMINHHKPTSSLSLLMTLLKSIVITVSRNPKQCHCFSITRTVTGECRSSSFFLRAESPSLVESQCRHTIVDWNLCIVSLCLSPSLCLSLSRICLSLSLSLSLSRGYSGMRTAATPCVGIASSNMPAPTLIATSASASTSIFEASRSAAFCAAEVYGRGRREGFERTRSPVLSHSDAIGVGLASRAVRL